MKDKQPESGQPAELGKVWERLDAAGREAVLALGEEYRQFLSTVKTERETVAAVVARAETSGFRALENVGKLNPGDRVYTVNRGKALTLAVIGRRSLEEGLQIVGAHGDSPRLDLKARPLFEKAGVAMFKTHYYGGIKKYHWVSIPLSLHGVVVKADGRRVALVIGEKEGDPVFTISDLLPHLAKDQLEKKMGEAISGEAMNLLAGTLPSPDGPADTRVKQAILDYLDRTYGITPEDLVSAELEAVPVWPARDVGLDRSLVAGYGQDDRVSVYTAVRALEEISQPDHTAMVLVVDREEVGNTGNTGMQAAFFTNCVAELAARHQPDHSDLLLRRILANSRALSADVKGALDPSYQDVADELNAARLGCGVVLTRHPNSAGKKGGSEASAEFVGYVRGLFDRHQVVWQAGQLGKVDTAGGGGSIAYLLAVHGMDVLDVGVALLGMHSPFEVASKADVFMAYRGYQAFLAH